MHKKGAAAMKKLLAFMVGVVIVSVIMIPFMVISVVNLGAFEKGDNEADVFKGEEPSIAVYIPEQNKIVKMKLEEYVKGVVAAEMPGEFEMEALKAQAVASRTLAVKSMKRFGGSGLKDHQGADISADYHESQAWISKEELKERWGKNYDAYWEKVNQAVEQTRGMVLTYNGELIQAVFCSTCGGRTASAKEVWGADIPYLVSVPCTWDQKSPRYSDKKEFTLAEIEQKLGPETGVVAAVNSGRQEVAKLLDTTESGRVAKIRIGSKVFSGIELREKLGLRSTNFSVEMKNDKFVFKTIGYGHGVGMCQYGANGMAKEGKTFRQILAYYYRETVLKNMFGS
jgi:stage II sporulation protein D